MKSVFNRWMNKDKYIVLTSRVCTMSLGHQVSISELNKKVVTQISNSESNK